MFVLLHAMVIKNSITIDNALSRAILSFVRARQKEEPELFEIEKSHLIDAIFINIKI